MVMTFGEALEWLKNGEKVARSGWNGKGMYLYTIRLVGQKQPFVMLMTTDLICVPWTCSQSDMLAEDWYRL